MSTMENDEAERVVLRHCLNRHCNGPEWWALPNEDGAQFRECPRCGYPCELEQVAESEMTPDALCSAALDDRLRGDY